MVAFLMLLLFAGNIKTGICNTPDSTLPRVDNQKVRYRVSNGSMNCYTLENNQALLQNGIKVFECPAGMQIIDFDIFEDAYIPQVNEGVPAAAHALGGILLRRRESIYLEIWDLLSHETLLVKDMTLYHPWKIRFADVDNDSVLEVCLGVYKKSPLHPVLAKRLFIYNFQHGLQPKWLGSRLARPFADFEFLENGDITELYALEINQLDRFCLNIYRWDSFGFTSVGENPVIFKGTAFSSTAFCSTVALHQGFQIQNGAYQQSLYIFDQQQIIAKYHPGEVSEK